MGVLAITGVSTFTIPAEKLDEALSIWKAMNTHPAYEKMKKGLRVEEGVSTRHFSFMDHDYHLTIDTAEDFLIELGFEVSTGKDGAVHIDSFDNTLGQEELFLRAIEHLVEPNSVIEWSYSNDDMSCIHVYNELSED